MNIVLKEVRKTGVKVKLSYGERKRERGRGRGRGGQGGGLHRAGSKTAYSETIYRNQTS